MSSYDLFNPGDQTARILAEHNARSYYEYAIHEAFRRHREARESAEGQNAADVISAARQARLRDDLTLILAEWDECKPAGMTETPPICAARDRLEAAAWADAHVMRALAVSA